MTTFLRKFLRSRRGRDNMRRRLVLLTVIVGLLLGSGVAPAAVAAPDGSRRQGYGPPRRTFEPPYDDAYANHLCSGGGGLLGVAAASLTCTVDQTVDKASGRMTASMKIASPVGVESSAESTADFGLIHKWTSSKAVTGLDLEITLDIAQLVMEHTGSTRQSHVSYAISRPFVSHDCNCASVRGDWQELLRLPAGETFTKLSPGPVVLRFPVYATDDPNPIPAGTFQIRVSLIVYNNLGRWVYNSDGTAYRETDTGTVATTMDASLVNFKVTEERVEDA